MTNLWCNHVKFPGQWVTGHGYDRVSSRAFTDLTDLTAVVAASAAPGSIRQLGIIVHGDEGELKMGIDDDHQFLVTPELIASKPDIRENLRRLGRYLHATATVSFYSCSAAASTRGSALLTSISQFWPECTVIGSITKGYKFASLTAGQLSDTLLTVIEPVTGMDQYFVPFQSLRPGRNQFFLPASLPRFLTVQATMKRARNGSLTHFPVGPDAFREFEMHYPPETREMILAHPALMIAGSTPGHPLPGSESQLYSRFLINMDWPPGYGREALRLTAGAYPGW